MMATFCSKVNIKNKLFIINKLTVYLPILLRNNNKWNFVILPSTNDAGSVIYVALCWLDQASQTCGEASCYQNL